MAAAGKEEGVESQSMIDESADDPAYQMFAQQNVKMLLRGMSWMDYFIFIVFYVGLGILLALPQLAGDYWFTSTFFLTNQEMTYVGSAVAIAWCFKWIYGMMTDNIPICGYRRKPYILIFMLLSGCTWSVILMGLTDDSLWKSLFVFFLISLFLCISDVVVDTVVVDLIQRLPSGYETTLVSMIRISRSIGELSSSLCAGYILKHKSPVFVFKITMVLCFVLSAISFAIKERRYEYLEHTEEVDKKKYDVTAWQKMLNKKQISKDEAIDLMHHGTKHVDYETAAPRLPLSARIRGFFARRWEAAKETKRKLFIRALIGPVVYAFIYTMVPGIGGLHFFYLTQYLGLDAVVMSMRDGMKALGHLIGLLTYNLAKRTKMHTILYISITMESFGYVLLALQSMRYNLKVGIPDIPITFAITFFLEFPAGFSLIPLQVIVSKNIPYGYEGSVFSFFMSCFNFGNMMSDYLSLLLAIFFGVNQDVSTMGKFHDVVIVVLICHILLLFIVRPLLPNVAGVIDDIDRSIDPLDLSERAPILKTDTIESEKAEMKRLTVKSFALTSANFSMDH
jgi:MFS family permease